MEYITNSPSQTEAVGAALAACLKPGAVIAYRASDRRPAPRRQLPSRTESW